MSDLMMASHQWSTRPNDERFWDLDELYRAVRDIRDNSVIARCAESDLRVEVDNDDLRLVGRTGVSSHVTHYAFGQLSTRAQAPGAYLSTLPATLAAQNINHGLKVNGRSNKDVRLLMYRNGANVIRSIATERWSPIWNEEIVSRLRPIVDGSGFSPPPAMPTIGWGGEQTARTRIATAEDARRSLTVKEGDVIGPAGLYASDRDMFIFLTNPDAVIDDGTDQGLQRGVIIRNAEVCGLMTFQVTTFLLRGTCGNHIIWNASNLREIKVKHVGTAPDRAFAQFSMTLSEYANASAYNDQQAIQSAKTRQIAGSMDDVLDVVFSKGLLSRKAAAESYALADRYSDQDGDPKTYWGFAQGVTRYSQQFANADTRTGYDRVAGKVLEMAF